MVSQKKEDGAHTHLVSLSLRVSWPGTPAAGLYCSTKWALRGINDSLAMEIEPLGLRSIIFEFGYFRTSFLTSGNWKRSDPGSSIEDYKAITEATDGALTGKVVV